MDLQDFYNGIRTLGDWFGKKLTDTQQDIIFKSVKFIPDRAWGEMVERYTKKQKPMPSNFPTPEDIINQWYIWRNENPELTAKEIEPVPCDDCLSRGLLWYRSVYEPLAKTYESLARCAGCENWKQHFNQFTKVPMYHRSELERDPLVLNIWPYEEG